MQGRSLGPYRLDRELGSGGMGSVWAAIVEGRAPGLDAGTRVALKIVHPHLLATPGFFMRFIREAEIGRSVLHGNVVRTYMADALVAGGVQYHFLVMEYVEGQTLRSLLTELDRVPEELCRHIGREVAKGLAAIHAAGVVHRDLKPENVLITADQHTVKVMDLGVARLADETIRLSQSGAFVGSVEYAAPEQFAAKHVGASADLHALGLVLYELATAQHPYRAHDFRGVMRRILNEKPRRPAEINPQLSPLFEELVLQLLEKEPEKRIESALDLVQVLEEGERSSWWKEKAKAIRAATKRPLRRIRIPRETALYGRDAELAKLRTFFDKAKAGDGNVLLVEGEAGIGKSRLVDEFVGLLAQQGEDVNFLFGSYPPGGAATASGAFSTAYREQFGEDGSAAWLSQTPILVPAFDALLRGETTPAGAEPLTKDSLQTVFVHATRNLAAERPTVVLIDDLHFAPDEGRALFASLALAVPGHRVLLVGTSRPGLDEQWIGSLTRMGHATRIALARLGPKDMVRLLADSLRSQHLAEELAGRIATKSDGNPFFVFEILRGLREGQFLTRKQDGTWATTRVIDEIQIPSSVLDLVNARVADLSAEERNALDVAACLGFEFDPGLVAAVLSVARIPLLQRLAHVEKAHRLVRSAGRRFVFDHHQVQEALYGALPEILREEYHAAIGTALEQTTGVAERDPANLDGALCVDLAEHFLKGGRGESALRYVDPALTHLAHGAQRAAAALLADRVLRIPGLVRGVERCELTLRRATYLDLLGRREAQAACLAEAKEAAEEVGSNQLLARTLLSEANLRISVAEWAGARESLDGARRLAQSLGDAGIEAAALQALGRLLNYTGHADEALGCEERAIELHRRSGGAAGVAGATTNVGITLLRLGRSREAIEWLRNGLAQAESAGARRFQAVGLVSLSRLHWESGEHETSRRCGERGLDMAVRIGDRRLEAMACNTLAGPLGALGLAAEARAMQERHVELAREVGDAREEAIGLANLGILTRKAGRMGDARRFYDEAAAIHRRIGNPEGEGIAVGNLGVALRLLGRSDTAHDALTTARALAQQVGDPFQEGYWAHHLAEVADDRNDGATAERLFDEAIALRRSTGHQEGLALSLASRGALLARMGRVEAAVRDLEEASALRRSASRTDGGATEAWLAILGRGSTKPLQQADEERQRPAVDPETALLWWRATSDRAHLVEAKRLLDDLLAKNSPEHHDGMKTRVRVNREVLAACKAEGIA